MISDPIVTELRKARKDLENECRNDWQLIYKKIVSLQNKHKKRLVSLPPQKISKYKSAA